MRKIIVVLAAVLLIAWEFTRKEDPSGGLKLSQYHSEFSIGAQIQSARLNKGLSLADLSKQSGLSKQHLQIVENNRAAPTRDFIIKLQEILEIEILLDGE